MSQVLLMRSLVVVVAGGGGRGNVIPRIAYSFPTIGCHILDRAECDRCGAVPGIRRVSCCSHTRSWDARGQPVPSLYESRYEAFQISKGRVEGWLDDVATSYYCMASPWSSIQLQYVLRIVF
jgi:hypothetical protein